ncbi:MULTISPECIES: glycoside hydrolase family 13 protein [Clostridium]|uniref:Alpha-glucosidase C-terminal domain-containing protein n=1 Tax=Clostridium cibarium TaxID=2762247 RepID=A0ABR8PW89_9CLOT|nr:MULTISPECIES: glycoside hydrolase family 13 protein [Clostridium]MBD7912399.1 alpha-glucosidase C-terminal domain-containing protein [Clostridium cibarium]
MQKYKKEFVINTDPDVKELIFGALPSEGRYFTKKCKGLGEGKFCVEVEAPKGDLYYHFKIAGEEDKILLDPNNMQDGAKNWHSICRIGTTSFNQIEFELTPSYIAEIEGGYIEIKIVSHQEWIQNITLIVEDKNGILTEYKCENHYTNGVKKYFRCVIEKEKIEDEKFCFKIYSKENIYYFCANQLLNKKIEKLFDCSLVRFNYVPISNTGVVYHIFPDSFARSGQTTIEGREMLDWDSEPRKKAFFGGNLKGIIDKLDYIKELGISYIYMTPIFYANSNDRYDCIDYMKIDPMLGDEENFHKLVTEAHKRNIKIVLDIVLNHCGTEFWMFDDLLRNQEKSKYKNYYIVYKYPVKFKPNRPNYSCWWDYGEMPQFNLDNKEVRDYLLGCCRYWIKKYYIDGWRIDVSSELSHDFLRLFRKEMKALNKEVVVIGENWKDSRTFLEGDQLDGVTNYLIWWKAFEPFFSGGKLKISELADNLMSCYFIYPHNRSIENWNVLSSHDVPRFSGKLLNEEDITNAIFLQMVIPGNPVIYYGDEIMIKGDDTPNNRRTMKWDIVNRNPEVLQWYRKLIQIRNKCDAIKFGTFYIRLADDEKKVLIIEREYKDEHIYCISNLSDKDICVDVDKVLKVENFVELLSDKEVGNQAKVNRKSSIILRKAI